MKYDEFLKMIKKELFDGIVGIFIFSVFQFIFLFFGYYSEGTFSKVVCVGWALYFAVLEVRFVFPSLGIKRKIRRMKASIGVESEEAFAELIEQAKVFDNQFFVTEKYVLNFRTFHAYERGLIYDVECYEYTRKERTASKLNDTCYYTDYGIKITYNVYMVDCYVFMSGKKKEERDALYRLLKKDIII